MTETKKYGIFEKINGSSKLTQLFPWAEFTSKKEAIATMNDLIHIITESADFINKNIVEDILDDGVDIANARRLLSCLDQLDDENAGGYFDKHQGTLICEHGDSLYTYDNYRIEVLEIDDEEHEC